MKLFNYNNKSKGKFQYFVNLKKMILIFRASLFVERSYNTFLVAFIRFKHVKVGKNIENMRQKYVKTCS